jgi:Arc/MetJ-type ribon-helix-helix transcriptional regulator
MALGNDPVKAAEEQRQSMMLPYNPVLTIPNTNQRQGARPMSGPPDSAGSMVTAPPGLNQQAQRNLTMGMAKGGVAKNKKSVLAEGGMLQEGGTVDPVSGNEVPTGSLQEEVRDDIPAQLSEGEFVFPADVVRFIGLDRLMKMRQAAKEGLAKMEAMGQMGNADEATMEDDEEFETELDDIISEIEEEAERGQI